MSCTWNRDRNSGDNWSEVCMQIRTIMHVFICRESAIQGPRCHVHIDQVSRRCQLQMYLQRKSNLEQTAPWAESGVLHFDGFATSPGVHRHGQKVSHWKPAGLGVLLLSDLSSVSPPAKGPPMGTFLFKVLQVICGHSTSSHTRQSEQYQARTNN